MTNPLTKKIDYTLDKILSILLVLSVPLLIAAAVSLGTQVLHNNILRAYAGEEIFTVLGSITTLITCFGSFCGAVRCSAWVKNAKKFHNPETAAGGAVQSAYAIVLFDLSCGLLLVIFSKPVLTALNVPKDIFPAVQRYLIAYCAALFLYDIGQFFMTVVNGTVSSVGILLMNILNTLLPLGTAFLLVGVLRLNELGVGLYSAFAGCLLILFSLFYLRRNHIFSRVKGQDFLPDFHLIFEIIGYGMIRSMQSVFVTAGEMLVLRKTNLLDADYLTCLSVSLPISAILGPMCTAVSLFVPVNFQLGKEQRVKEFMRTSLSIAALSGLLCAVVYILAARPYFTSLFPDNPAVVAYGVTYWRYYGVSLFFLALLQPMLNFYEAVGYNWFYMLEGVFEGSGKLICALVLIPAFGVFGRNMSYLLGWILGCAELLLGYLLLRKQIYAKCQKNHTPEEVI